MSVIPTATNAFLADVLAGLSRPQKQLAPKYFYDPAGSELFDRITRLEEYYPTRTELAIMLANSAAMSGRIGPNSLLIEFGGGSLVKVRYMLDHLAEPCAYIPVDVSGEHLERAASELKTHYPNLVVLPVVADFTRAFPIPRLLKRESKRIVYFPGSTIGNFDPDEVHALLCRIADLIGAGGALLLGVDLRKDPTRLKSAYNDALGVTAAFNLNLLVRINRELGADFNVAAFRHSACYNVQLGRIEMHLVSMDNQLVTISERSFAFQVGETIHTENSYKYDLENFARTAQIAGLKLESTWTDDRHDFAVLYLARSD